jgi:radical SAM protein with 4Fe4S-binding SPASM domain
MSYEKAVEYCSKLPKSVKKMHLHFSGESFLNPEIPQITKFLSEQGLFLSVSTNGTLPAERYLQTLESGLDQLIFAIDGATAETHEKYRVGSDFEKIMKNLTTVTREKPEGPKVGVQFLVTRFNENEIGQMKNKLSQIGVDFFNLKTLSLDIAADENLEGEKLENARKFLPKNEKYSRYRKKTSGLKVKYPILICPFIYQPVIGADGEVSLCCIDLEKQIKFGNLNDYDSFEDLWNSEDYRSQRKEVLNKKLPICQRCNYCLIGLQSIQLT